MKVELKCISCGAVFPPSMTIYTCPECNGLLDVVLALDGLRGRISWNDFRGRCFNVWRYRELLPVFDDNKIVSLEEGGTPLVKCDKLAKWVGVRGLYIKFEGANPTGSFKDRGMTVGVTKALEYGAKAVACASTGNTAASMAAYAARAGLKAIVILPWGKVALGKLAQAVMHGAEVVGIEGNFDQALAIVRSLSERHGIYLLNSVNPWRLEGQKTVAYEIIDQLGGTPDLIALPMGNCGNISALWKGLKELLELKLVGCAPRLVGVQATGASPVVDMFKSGSEMFKPVENPETVATAIRIGNPVNWPKAIRALRESDGLAEKVTDEEIIKAQQMIACLEGLGVEPASAASVAGLKKLVEEGSLDANSTVVCICTGHLLKDPEQAVRASRQPLKVKAELGEVERALSYIISSAPATSLPSF